MLYTMMLSKCYRRSRASSCWHCRGDPAVAKTLAMFSVMPVGKGRLYKGCSAIISRKI